MENRAMFGIKKENGNMGYYQNGTPDELEMGEWIYWSERFNKLIGQQPTTLYDLTAEQLKALVLELETEFSSPIDIVWTMPSAFSDEGLCDVERHPSFQCYLDIMKKHNAI